MTDAPGYRETTTEQRNEWLSRLGIISTHGKFEMLCRDLGRAEAELATATARAEKAEADFANEVAISAKAHKEIDRLDTLLAEQTVNLDEALLRLEEGQDAFATATARAEKAEAERVILANRLACIQSQADLDPKMRDWSTHQYLAWASQEAAKQGEGGKTIMADNFHVTVCADMGVLESALKLACSMHPTIFGYKSVVGTTESYEYFKPKDITPDTPRLILFWMNADSVIPFPAPMKPEGLAPFIRAWLESVPYGQRPDHDGDNDKGFYLTTGNGWNHISDMGHSSCLDIRPCWMMYGK